jgi:hypothetical protein
VFIIPLGRQRASESKSSNFTIKFFTATGNQKPAAAFRRDFIGAWDMARADEFRRYAAECVRVAQKTNNPNDKAMMLEMAQKWRELAERSERESDTKKNAN